MIRFLVVLLASLFCCACAAPAADTTPQRPKTSKDALRMLKHGNERFVRGWSRHPHAGRNWRRSLTAGQHPFATIVGCSDSRVPPELIFDTGIGDLFVIRVAGNVIDTDVAASVEYGVQHLHTKLVVVLGHDSCGAVTAAVNQRCGLASHEPTQIRALLGRITPALEGLDLRAPRPRLIRQAVERNATLAAHDLADISELTKAMHHDNAQIVRAVYDIETGIVRWLGTIERPAQPLLPEHSKLPLVASAH
ncbi:MAG: carbonic anhydrase [Myxococcales bacterium]|nr:carbonic anhydrase [Myxococcales bacterium]